MSERLPDPGRFNASPPRDRLRGRQPLWHPLRYIVELLPRRLEALAADLAVPPGGRVLDFGSADAPYRHFFPPETDFVTADLPGNPDARVVLEPDGRLPVADGGFDAVLSTQVLEHVPDPALYLEESYRVLRPGGRILLSTHGFMVWHPDPIDHWRWTCSGLEAAVERAGFRVVRFEGIMGLAASGVQLVQDAFYWRLPRRAGQLLAVVCQALIKVVDRFEPEESRRRNALVFALVAEKTPAGR